MSTNNSKTFTGTLFEQIVNCDSDSVKKIKAAAKGQIDKLDAQRFALNTTDHLQFPFGEMFDNWIYLTDNTNCKRPVVKKVIFNDPATIVFFEDGNKEVVKVKPGEKFDKWTGLAMCIMKRMYGPGFHGLFKKWCGKGKDKGQMDECNEAKE